MTTSVHVSLGCFEGYWNNEGRRLIFLWGLAWASLFQHFQPLPCSIPFSIIGGLLTYSNKECQASNKINLLTIVGGLCPEWLLKITQRSQDLELLAVGPLCKPQAPVHSSASRVCSPCEFPILEAFGHLAGQQLPSLTEACGAIIITVAQFGFAFAL